MRVLNDSVMEMTDSGVEDRVDPSRVYELIELPVSPVKADKVTLVGTVERLAAL
jgi:hypothetical protein